MSNLQLLKEFARQIKYRTLSEYIGKQIIISGLDAVENDVLSILQRPLNADCKLVEPEKKYQELALAKYGIINLDFAVPEQRFTDNYQTGMGLLRELGFNSPISENEAESINEIIDSLAQSHLETLVDQLSKHQTHMLIILDAVGEHPLRLKLPADYFPRTFIVRDACVTNVQSIWLTKHVYL